MYGFLHGMTRVLKRLLYPSNSLSSELIPSGPRWLRSSTIYFPVSRVSSVFPLREIPSAIRMRDWSF